MEIACRLDSLCVALGEQWSVVTVDILPALVADGDPDVRCQVWVIPTTGTGETAWDISRWHGQNLALSRLVAVPMVAYYTCCVRADFSDRLRSIVTCAAAHLFACLFLFICFLA